MLFSRAHVKPLIRPRRPRKTKRYSRPYAGDRVQIDKLMDPSAMKVAQGLHQFTAVDDCTRLRVQAAPVVLGLYPDKTGVSAAHFFEERVLREFPFAIERMQSDAAASLSIS